MIDVRGTYRHVPKWWADELALIDPTYFLVYNQEYDYFTVTKKVRYLYEQNGEYGKVERDIPLATFRNLNDAALNNLRERKAVGRKFERESNPTAYLDWIKGEGREARKKARELALEMQAEGLIKINQAERGTGFFSTA